MTSRFVGGMGAFDGFEFYYRQNEFTVGVLGGAQVNDPVSVLSNTGTKGSLFLNYRTGQDIFHYYDGTLAYGRQMVSNKLDREFLYIQNTFAVDPTLSFYESSEIELDEMTNGVITPAFNFSNTNVSANYYPVEWFSANLGYDATRPVYLFETMKSTPDSLFDKNLLQGYRATVTFHLPLSMTLSEMATYRAKQDTMRDAHTITTALRITDIFDTEISPAFATAISSANIQPAVTSRLISTRHSTTTLTFRCNDYTTALAQRAESPTSVPKTAVLLVSRFCLHFVEFGLAAVLFAVADDIDDAAASLGSGWKAPWPRPGWRRSGYESPWESVSSRRRRSNRRPAHWDRRNCRSG